MKRLTQFFFVSALICATFGATFAQVDFSHSPFVFADSPINFDSEAPEKNGAAALAAVELLVSKTADSNDGVCGVNCSLREAVAVANASLGSVNITINIPAADPGCTGGVCTIVLSGGELVINKLSAGAVTIVTAGLSSVTVSGNNSSRVFKVFRGSDLTLTELTVSNGFAVNGAGIYNDGTLTVVNSTISNNTASDFGGGVLNNGGGGVFNLINSTVSGNAAGGANNNGGGGGIDSSGTLNITNSTIAFNRNTAVTTFSNSGGVWSRGIMSMRSTIIASNTILSFESAPDLCFAGGALTSNGNNLLGNGSVTCKPVLYRTAATTHDLVNQDPQLAPLGNYGGKSQTHSFMSFASPAIDKGISGGLITDQRTKVRVFDIPSRSNEADGTDIGAYELQNPNAAAVSVSGRATAARGGVSKAIVYLTAQTGKTRQTTTDLNGNFSFTGVSSGETIVINISHKRFTFQPQVVSVNDDITDLQFQADQ